MIINPFIYELRPVHIAGMTDRKRSYTDPYNIPEKRGNLLLYR